MRCKKFKAASREEEGYPHRFSTDRATRQQRRSVRLGRGYYDAIDLAVDPDVLPAEPPSKVARPIPSPAAEENPTSVQWAPPDSGGKVEHENITLRLH